MHRKEQTILIATGAEAVLVALRFTLAYLSGSLGLRANAWHSLADLFVAFVVYLGLVLARQESKRFSGLFARIEHIVALFVAGFIFYMGLEIFIEALGEGIELRYVPVATIGALFGVVISYLVARYKLYVGNQTGSPSLIASGYHSKMDMYSSLAVLVGLMGSLFGMGSLDKIAALIVVVFIFFASLEIFFTNVRALVRGESAQISWLEQFKKPGKTVIVLLILLIVLGYFASGVYYLKWNERGVVLRFGEIRESDIPPGLHYRLPYPFERVDRVEIESVRRIDTGKYLLLTGDENLIDVNIAVHYQVSDPVRYLYSLSAPDQLVLYAARAAIRQVIGERNIDDVLTV
ncbi:TPA: cation diffusion facilitator family transporter, partial [Candidatus Poribacteria bacterium]|nr:cation diffusion facilitator family transporter [Candidatus Poribacteria bacterium]